MIIAGRVLSAVALAAFVTVLMLNAPSVERYVFSHHPVFVGVSILGGVGAISGFTAWGLALHHCGIDIALTPVSRRRWRMVLTLAIFFGAWLYWLARPIAGRLTSA